MSSESENGQCDQCKTNSAHECSGVLQCTSKYSKHSCTIRASSTPGVRKYEHDVDVKHRSYLDTGRRYFSMMLLVLRWDTHRRCRWRRTAQAESAHRPPSTGVGTTPASCRRWGRRWVTASASARSPCHRNIHAKVQYDGACVL